MRGYPHQWKEEWERPPYAHAVCLAAIIHQWKGEVVAHSPARKRNFAQKGANSLRHQLQPPCAASEVRAAVAVG